MFVHILKLCTEVNPKPRHQNSDFEILFQGAAMYLSVLKMLKPAIVFEEEASKILEPQVLAALQPSVQHLILIGDHYQLSPTVACHELER